MSQESPSTGQQPTGRPRRRRRTPGLKRQDSVTPIEPSEAAKAAAGVPPKSRLIVPPPQEEKKLTVEDVLNRDPRVKEGVQSVVKAIRGYQELQKEIAEAQQSKLIQPGSEDKILAGAQGIGRAIDQLLGAMRGVEDPQIQQVAMGVYQDGIIYLQGIVFGMHYSRNVLSHGEMGAHERVVTESFALLDRANQRQNG